jgi:hypothetical protein
MREVDTVPERQVSAAGTVQPKLVRRIEYRGVAIRRAHHHDHAVFRGNALAMQIDVFVRFAHQELHRAVEAQRFLDGRIEQLRLAPQPLPEVGSVGEHVQHVAKQVRGGFVPAIKAM